MCLTYVVCDLSRSLMVVCALNFYVVGPLGHTHKMVSDRKLEEMKNIHFEVRIFMSKTGKTSNEVCSKFSKTIEKPYEVHSKFLRNFEWTYVLTLTKS